MQTAIETYLLPHLRQTFEECESLLNVLHQMILTGIVDGPELRQLSEQLQDVSDQCEGMAVMIGRVLKAGPEGLAPPGVNFPP